MALEALVGGNGQQASNEEHEVYANRICSAGTALQRSISIGIVHDSVLSWVNVVSCAGLAWGLQHTQLEK